MDWRFISLRMINATVDYGSHFPAGYEAGHTAGLRLLRVAARARAEHGRGRGRPAVHRDRDPGLRHRTRSGPRRPGLSRHPLSSCEPALAEAGLPAGLADALDDESFDAGLRSETGEALSLTGKDVGTPIIHFQPPDGVAFFGPVISRPPSETDAARLWDHVIGLAGFPGFAELKRSLRERPQLASFGVEPGEVGIQEDWHAGSRRQKK